MPRGGSLSPPKRRRRRGLWRSPLPFVHGDLDQTALPGWSMSCPFASQVLAGGCGGWGRVRVWDLGGVRGEGGVREWGAGVS